jgi:hypothetical protein
MLKPTAEDVVRFVAEWCAENAQRESPWLYPDPSWTISPESLMNALSDQFDIPRERIGKWVDEVHDGPG